jgi:hypothetical protein
LTLPAPPIADITFKCPGRENGRAGLENGSGRLENSSQDID